MNTPRISGSAGFPLGAVLAAAVTALAVAAGATSQPVVSVIGLVAVIDLIALLSTARATLATAAVSWCLHVGFVLDRHGDLVLSAQARHDALVLGLNALGVLILVSTMRAVMTPMLHLREHDPAAPAVPAQRQPVLTQSQREAR